MPISRVLITGASSGIGAGLAQALAAPGITLHLGGRDAARLQAIAVNCRARGAEVMIRPVSVTDAVAMRGWITQAAPLDLVIANAGISAGTAGMVESAEQTRAIFATNLDGVLNTVLPAVAVMAAQKPDAAGVRGRIAAVASIAAFIPGAMAPAYCASKAAVDHWMMGAAPSMQAQGILLTSLCPGFIETPMTAGNDFPMPGLMSPARAAGLMLRGIRAGRRRVAFPWWLAAAARLSALAPPRLRERLSARLPAKKAL